MYMPFFFTDDNYKLLTFFSAIAGIILITKSKKALTRVFEQFVIPTIGDVVQSSLETQRPDTFFYDREDNSVFNQNCYHYLFLIKNSMPQSVYEILPRALQDFFNDDCVKDQYSPFVAYGNIYKAFFLSLEDQILACLEDDHSEKMTKFVQTLFENDNHVLERTFMLIKPSLINKTCDVAELRSDVKNRIKNDEVQSNNLELPSYKCTLISRGINIFARTVKEQYTTNIPTIKYYPYHDLLPFKEFRFGTQAQRVNNTPRINPFFRAWCRIQKPKQPGPIAHIYFNNLTRDRDTIEGRVAEVPWSKALHVQETETPAVAFITLPADKGLLSKSGLTDEASYSTSDSLALFTRIAMEKESEFKIKDFHISPYVRKLLYRNEDREKIILEALLQKTLNVLKLNKKEILTATERQACYFHFIKFELTDTIIKALQPDSINFACKDAIDRAGVSSLYYNLMKSIETNHPMSEQDFLKGLHAAPASVKGRALNHHFEIIHNALSLYTKANPTTVGKACPWLINWCKQFDITNQKEIKREKTAVAMP